MADPRVVAVEENLFALWTAGAACPLFRSEPADDVLALHSDVAFPLFNSVTGARFADVRRRTHEIVDSYVEAGLPWMWWLTPSYTSPELESVLEERGLERLPVPGMHRELIAPVSTGLPAGVEIQRTQDTDTYADVMVAAFGMPQLLDEPLAELMRQVLPGSLNVLARLDGELVGCGTAYVAGPTAGLYNIAVQEEARGRGIGYAVTATLMDLAAEVGARHVILHSSEAGLPVYERLGFVEVCQTPQYLWLPEG
jgi:GNAT superfamily N-acetyltransferase